MTNQHTTALTPDEIRQVQAIVDHRIRWQDEGERALVQRAVRALTAQQHTSAHMHDRQPDLATKLVTAAHNVAPDNVTPHDAADMVAAALRELHDQGYENIIKPNLPTIEPGAFAEEIEAGAW